MEPGLVWRETIIVLLEDEKSSRGFSSARTYFETHKQHAQNKNISSSSERAETDVLYFPFFLHSCLYLVTIFYVLSARLEIYQYREEEEESEWIELHMESHTGVLSLSLLSFSLVTKPIMD